MELKEINNLIKNITLPKLFNLVLERIDGNNFAKLEYQDDLENIVVNLGFPFYLCEKERCALVGSPEDIHKWKLRSKFKVISLNVNSNQILELKFEEGVLLALPAMYFGWSIYLNDRQLIQHEGWDGGLEYNSKF